MSWVDTSPGESNNTSIVSLYSLWMFLANDLRNALVAPYTWKYLTGVSPANDPTNIILPFLFEGDYLELILSIKSWVIET